MGSALLETPLGVVARLGSSRRSSADERYRALAKQLVAERYGVEEKAVRLLRDAPAGFGSTAQRYAEVARRRVQLEIRAVHFGTATVVALVNPGVRVGIDLRDPCPDEGAVAEMQLHSHLFNEDDIDSLLQHWTKVQAVRDADGRRTPLRPEWIMLDPVRDTGWVPDARARYSLLDVSRDGWIITLALQRTDTTGSSALG